MTGIDACFSSSWGCTTTDFSSTTMYRQRIRYDDFTMPSEEIAISRVVDGLC